MFGYLFFFRLTNLTKYGIPLPSGQTNLIEMILVLRVIGVAFEINGSWLAFGRRKDKDGDKLTAKLSRDGVEIDEEFLETINPSFIDLVHYSFNYVGLLTGWLYILLTRRHDTVIKLIDG